jgi:hypothetical protein
LAFILNLTFILNPAYILNLTFIMHFHRHYTGGKKPSSRLRP